MYESFSLNWLLECTTVLTCIVQCKNLFKTKRFIVQSKNLIQTKNEFIILGINGLFVFCLRCILCFVQLSQSLGGCSMWLGRFKIVSSSPTTGLGSTFFSILNVPFFSILLKKATFFSILFLSFCDLWNPKGRSVPFRSFLKNGKEHKERNILLQRTEKNARKFCSFAKERENVRSFFYIYIEIYIDIHI